ncbi:hypothetical protein DH2020_008983 [Rehmannia glutinosa]|uniref:Dof zinc finger protein n=1 Tax=Rehmannia glutinosa TaxID=99300 RepID=A0ABR0VGD3_REHGL
MAAARHHPPPPPPPHLKCPRCDSSNTKFCYYNNYSLSQPRYFCKACRRYWTHGGTLRNVPVGGGCRKNKRAKTGPSPLLQRNDQIARTQCVSPAIRAQRTTGLISGQSFGPNLPPVIPPMGNSFYAGGGFLPSFGGGGGGGGQFGSNMSLLQAMSLPGFKSPAAPNQFQPPNNLFSSQQNLMPQRPLNSWGQNLVNATGSSSSAVGSGFWSHGADGSNQAGSSFNPNQWSDNQPGFNPSHQ